MVEKNIKKVRSASSKRLALRENLWPDLDEKNLWLRKEKVGFTTIPRTMGLIGRILDQLSGKGFPLFNTYFALWCRVYDEAFVEIRNAKEIAFESGFSGPRGEVTWRTRMRRLQELNLIDIRAGLAGDFQYVVIFNPILVIASIYKEEGKTYDLAYSSLMARLIEIGADDLDAAVSDI